MTSSIPENASKFSCAWAWLRSLPKNSWAMTANFAKKSRKLAQDDPRRITHSLKVGLALTLVSMFFYLQPLYDSFGANTVWAVMTVIVVMEFSVGATLGKGLNRMLATVLGGSLGVGVQELATLLGKKEQPILIALFLYMIGAIMTFVRFVPEVKAKYDYGLTIFILTFSLVSISGYRDDHILELACKRVLTIIIGSFIAMISCVCIFPVWNGENLHNLVAGNIEKLGNFLEGFGDDWFSALEDGKPKTDKSFAEEYESFLTSKSREDTMANFARWEPCHGQFRWRHPWQKYLQVGNITRQCACKIEALDFYLRSKIQKPNILGIKIIKDSSRYISLESGIALKELSSSVKSMTCLSTTYKAHITNAKGAIESLNSLLRSNPWEEGINLLEIAPAAAVTSLLTDVVICIERISEAVDELASLAHFKSVPASTTTTKVLPLIREGTLQPISSSDKVHCNNVRKESGSSSIEVIVQ